MKYIRTKDGRIAEIKENMVVRVCDDATRLVYKDRPYSCVLTGDDAIIKQADTIEGLCDEFVAVVNDDPQQYQFMKPFEYYMRSLNPKRVSLFGAISTNKGIIYVAKMNDKGELELL